MHKKTIFFRNDDIRESIEPELIKLIDIFTTAGIPISLAVEPANVTPEVVNWMLDKKRQHPDIIELIQHGYNHNKHSVYPKGTEFGTYRTFNDQYQDIQKGKQLMDLYFKDDWFPAMAFPYGSYNSPALQALDKAQFNVLSTGVTFSFPHQFKDLIGRLLRKDLIKGKKISHHNRIRKPYKFVELDCSVNIIETYLSETKANHFTLEKIIGNIKKASFYSSVIGILFHHRFHTEEFEMIEKLIAWIKESGEYEFSTMEQLYRNFNVPLVQESNCELTK